MLTPGSYQGLDRLNQNCHITSQIEIGVAEFRLLDFQLIVSIFSRYQKMVEWIDNVEMAIQKVCASKVYTSAEFKREKDNFHVSNIL